MNNKFRRTMFFIAAGVLVLGFSGCVENIKPKKKVTIFVLDDFASKDSHGRLVAKIVGKSCFGKCEIIEKDVIFQLSAREKSRYLKGLMDVLQYAETHPNEGIVVNISLTSERYSLSEHLLMLMLNEKHVVVVAAAGNDNTLLPQFPAAFRQAIAVGAVSGSKKTGYSNYGSHIGLCASGFGSKKYLGKETKSDGFYVEESLYYSVRGGTSFAAPRVAGLIAYLMHQRPELNAERVIELVKENAKPLRDGYYTKGMMGAGKVSFFSSLRAADPLYEKVFAFHITAVVVVLLLLLLLGRQSGLLHMSIVFFWPFLAVLNIFLIFRWDLILGSITGGISIILVNLTLAIVWFWLEAKEKKKRRRMLEESYTPEEPYTPTEI